MIDSVITTLDEDGEWVIEDDSDELLDQLVKEVASGSGRAAFSTDAHGMEHAPKGSPTGGQFVGKEQENKAAKTGFRKRLKKMGVHVPRGTSLEELRDLLNDALAGESKSESTTKEKPSKAASDPESELRRLASTPVSKMTREQFLAMHNNEFIRTVGGDVQMPNGRTMEDQWQQALSIAQREAERVGKNAAFLDDDEIFDLFHSGLQRGAVFSHDDDDAYDDTQERAEAIADLLLAIYGDDAVDVFDELEAVGGISAAMSAWDPRHHPRGKNGRFIAKNSPEAVAAAKEKIKEALKQPKDAGSMEAVLDHLNILTVKQIHELRKDYEIKGAGKNRAELVQKIAERLDRGRRFVEEKESESKPDMTDLDYTTTGPIDRLLELFPKNDSLLAAKENASEPDAQYEESKPGLTTALELGYALGEMVKYDPNDFAKIEPHLKEMGWHQRKGGKWHWDGHPYAQFWGPKEEIAPKQDAESGGQKESAENPKTSLDNVSQRDTIGDSGKQSPKEEGRTMTEKQQQGIGKIREHLESEKMPPRSRARKEIALELAQSIDDDSFWDDWKGFDGHLTANAVLSWAVDNSKLTTDELKQRIENKVG